MIDLRQKWHGAPVWVWLGGSTVVTVAGLIWLRRYRAAKAGGSVAPALGAQAAGGTGWDGAGSGSFGDGSTFVPSEWSNETPAALADVLTWRQPSLPSVAPAAPVVDAGTAASQYDTKMLGSYAAPLPYQQNTPITVPLDQLNRTPTPEEQAAGHAVVGVTSTDIPTFSFGPAVSALPVYQQPGTTTIFGGTVANPLIPNEFASPVTGAYDPGAAFRYFYK